MSVFSTMSDAAAKRRSLYILWFSVLVTILLISYTFFGSNSHINQQNTLMTQFSGKLNELSNLVKQTTKTQNQHVASIQKVIDAAERQAARMNSKQAFNEVKEVKKVTFALPPVDDTNVIPKASLAYQMGSPAQWDVKFKLREMQKAKSNAPSAVANTYNLKTLFQMHWEPTFSCEYPTRVGRIGDGGKWTCNPQNMLISALAQKRKLVSYSMGSFNEYSFETGLYELFSDNIEIHTFDMDKPKPESQPPSFVNFHQMKIVGSAFEVPVNRCYSLTGIRRMLDHVDTTIDILKVDIEGSEYGSLIEYLGRDCKLNANMLLMETHWDSAARYNELFDKLSNNCGMELFMKEPNIQFSNGEVLEWCWVKVNWNDRPRV